MRRGTIALLDQGAANKQMLAFIREEGGGRMLVVHNLGAAVGSAGPWALHASAAKLVHATVDGAKIRVAGGISVTVPAGASAIWRLR